MTGLGSGKLELLQAKIQSLSVHRGAEFTLTSGKKTNLYFDMKATTMDPEGGHLAAHALNDYVRGIQFDFMTGIALGAVPLVARMVELLHKERPVTGLIARSGTKSHGMGRQIEGIREPKLLQGKRVLVVEDVTTTGGSISTAVSALRNMEAVVSDAVCIVMRSRDAHERLASEQVKLHYLFTEQNFS
jgi:orotate phosphoribosyltransferase